MAENKTFFKRRNYFIEKGFQARFILRFCALVALGGLLIVILLYLFGRHSTTVSIINSRVAVRSTSDFLLPILIQTIAIVFVLMGLGTIAITLFVSHMIAGPLFRFKKVLKSLEDGDFNCEFRIRHTDQLKDLASALNAMINKNRAELVKMKLDFTALKENIERISQEDLREDKRGVLGEAKKTIERLNNMLNFYKT